MPRRIPRRRLSLAFVVPAAILGLAILAGTLFWFSSQEPGSELAERDPTPLPETGRLCYQGSLNNGDAAEVHAFADLVSPQARLAVMYDRDPEEVLVSSGELAKASSEYVYALEGTVVAPSDPESNIEVRFLVASNRLYLPGDQSIGAVSCGRIEPEVESLESAAGDVLRRD